MSKKASETKENESGIGNFFERFDEKSSKRKEKAEKKEEIPAKQETTKKDNNKEAVLKPEEIKIIRTGERDGWH